MQGNLNYKPMNKQLNKCTDKLSDIIPSCAAKNRVKINGKKAINGVLLRKQMNKIDIFDVKELNVKQHLDLLEASHGQITLQTSETNQSKTCAMYSVYSTARLL